MFKIDHTPTFTRNVPIRTPKGSGFIEESLSVTFRVLSDEELEAAFEAASGEDLRKGLTAMVERVEGVLDADNQPIPFTPELLERVLSYQHVRLAISKVYGETMADAALGNSNGSDAPGQMVN